MIHVRFLAATGGNPHVLVDRDPGHGEVSRTQAELWRAAGVPMEFVDDTGQLVDPAIALKARKRK